MTLDEFTAALQSETKSAKHIGVLRYNYADQLKRAEEAERRVRWLESRASVNDKSYSEYNKIFHSYDCVYCGASATHYETERHKNDCEVFLPDGTPKPTPEDFE